jgi:hypothetical protein
MKLSEIKYIENALFERAILAKYLHPALKETDEVK